MLSREDLKLLNELLHGGDRKTNEAEKLSTKIALLCKQIEIMDKAQKDAEYPRNDSLKRCFRACR